MEGEAPPQRVSLGKGRGGEKGARMEGTLSLARVETFAPPHLILGPLPRCLFSFLVGSYVCVARKAS